MKLAYILDTFPSLTETFIAREIAALRRRGVSIEVFALQAGPGAGGLGPVSWSRRARGALERLRGPARAHYFKAVGADWWQVNKNLPAVRDITHIHAGWASHPAFIAWGAAETAGLPWSFSGHARDLFVASSTLPDKLQAARFAAVCTRAGQQFLQQQVPACAAKVLYVPHGLEMAAYPFRQPDLQAPMRLLSVGRLVEKKGFSVLLEALAILKAQSQPFQATIIGDGPLREPLIRRRDGLGLDMHVTFTGAQSADTVCAAMQAANCFALPAIIASNGDRDGLPNVLLEAAACGLPLVATPVGGITDLLDKSVGYLCEPNDAANLAVMLRRVFENKDRTLEMCQQARARVEDRFDIERNVEPLARAFMPG